MDHFEHLVVSTNLLNVGADEDDPQFNMDNIKAFTLVGKVVSEKTFNTGAIKNTLLKAWNCRKKVTCNDLEDGMMAFVFEDKGDFDKVQNLSPWSFRGQLVVLTHWHPDLALININMECTQFWVQAKNLPARFMTPKMAEMIGNKLGRFIKTDLATESQRWRSALRIRAEMNVTKPLIDSLSIQVKPGVEFMVEIRYERLSDFCFNCGRVGHKFTTCSELLLPLEESVNPPLLRYGSWLKAESTFSINPHSSLAKTQPRIRNQSVGESENPKPQSSQKNTPNTKNTPASVYLDTPGPNQYDDPTTPLSQANTCPPNPTNPDTTHAPKSPLADFSVNAQDMDTTFSEPFLSTITVADKVEVEGQLLPQPSQREHHEIHLGSDLPRPIIIQNLQVISQQINPTPSPCFKMPVPLQRSPMKNLFTDPNPSNRPKRNLLKEFPEVQSKKSKIIYSIPSSTSLLNPISSTLSPCPSHIAFTPSFHLPNPPSPNINHHDIAKNLPVDISHSVTLLNPISSAPLLVGKNNVVINERKPGKWKRLARNRNLWIKMGVSQDEPKNQSSNSCADPAGSQK
ncbi:hypothetical protein BUALT_Bualt19G0046200 [Buddleja alternifolia]|uniref:CCHC-type domain-containing protein n=1 Tax=Buddleja alternifolia TaxID=168488 RepID=A0AAV6W1R2_9LAMI|nr:hypothetical protein BUALT_Bualt19G0046200 [Buddleja alternifolia]